MGLQAVCQRCGNRETSWSVNQAEFHVRELQHWKVQLCERCAVQVEMLLRSVLTRSDVLFGVEGQKFQLQRADGPAQKDETR